MGSGDIVKVKARVETSDDAAVAIVKVTADKRRTIEARRSAKRHPKDQPAPAIGADLAMGRALIAAGEALIARADAWLNPPHWEPMSIHLTSSPNTEVLAQRMMEAMARD